MINKKNLWFLTLFSLVLVLSVYYVTMPNELLVTNNSAVEETTAEASSTNEEETDVISTLKVEDDTAVEEEIATLKELLTDDKATVQEKNQAFEQLKNINSINGQEETIEQKIKSEFKLNSFVKIEEDEIKIVIGSKEHNTELANKIMRSVQTEFEEKKYISVQFQS